MQLKTVKVSELRPHSGNPNTHPQEQLQELQNSLDQFDQVKNIVVWNDQVIAGCGLLEAAKYQNREEIEVQDVSDWPEEKAIKFMIADNRLADLAIMDDNLLADLLKEFDEPLDIPGIDQDFLDGLDLSDGMGREGNTDSDNVPDVKEPIVKSGELWLLGKHRVLCSDSTVKENVERLLDGEKADMVFTDPPFENNSGIMHDMIKNIDSAFNNARLFCDGLMIWFWDNLAFPPFFEMVTSKHIWHKTNGWQAGHFETMYCYHNDKTRHEQKVYSVNNVGGEDNRKDQGNHPTPKPIKLISNILNENKHNKILDTFLGSGSTLIACEKMNRICFGCEIDPHYCTVILERWAQLTGKDPIREDGAKFSELKKALMERALLLM